MIHRDTTAQARIPKENAAYFRDRIKGWTRG